jgi:hypothetical protein
MGSIDGKKPEVEISYHCHCKYNQYCQVLVCFHFFYFDNTSKQFNTNLGIFEK